jgi:peptide/nickel transport system substrate-binding protein
LRAGVAVASGPTAAFLLACGGEDKEQGQATTTGGATATAAAAAGTPAPKRGGRLNIHSASAVNSLNPVINYFEGTAMSGVHVYDRLVSTRPGKDTAKEYVLEAAQSVEQPDPTTVVFRLKPGMKFHDRAPVSGRAVTADDIVKSEIYVRDNPRSADSSFQNASMQSVEAPDAQTVVFKLKAPNAYLFSGSQLCTPTSHCIIPKELLDKFETLDTAWQIGSGPYQLAEYELSVRYLYKRFEGFREAAKGLPYIDERELRILTDAAAAEAAFRSGQIHLWTNIPLPNIADALKKDMAGKIEMHEWAGLNMHTLSFNATKAPWNDVRVREALYRVVNRRQYVDLLEQGRGTICPGPLSVGLTEYQLDPKQTEKHWQQDARAAKQLLDAAGFPYDRQFDLIMSNNSPKTAQSGEIFQGQVAPVGIKLRVTPLPSSEFIGARVATGNWELWSSPHPAYDTPQVPLRLQHTKTFNVHVYNGLKDPEVDRMIERAEVTLDKNERIKLVKDIQLALMDKYHPMPFLYTPAAFLGRYTFVRDYEVNPATNHPMYRTEMWLDR